jgi:hypothetical protein
MRDILVQIFTELNDRISQENSMSEESGALKIRPVEIKVLGQLTLLANKMVTDILPKYHLVYDSDSVLIWLPPQSQFIDFCDFNFVRVKLLDAESALVSKAVKAPQKNKLLIIEAIASQLFPSLISRIQEHGGNINFFLEDNNGKK